LFFFPATPGSLPDSRDPSTANLAQVRKILPHGQKRARPALPLADRITGTVEEKRGPMPQDWRSSADFSAIDQPS